MAKNIPCPYCKTPGRSLLSIEVSDAETIFVDITGNLLRAFSNSDESFFIETASINYCPVCGRDLLR